MRPLFPISSVSPDATTDRGGVTWAPATADELRLLLAGEHYLGPLGRTLIAFGGWSDGELVAGQAWAPPTSRRLPADGTWLELARWCLTPAAGANAGSRMHRYVVAWLRRRMPAVTTLISYSDPSRGHTGALYKACNWEWAPTWHRLSPPPTGNGSWGADAQSVKDRWIFALRPDDRRAELLRVKT